MTVNRSNGIGLEFLLSECTDRSKTFIRLKGTDKSMIVDFPLEEVSAMWYKWQMQRRFIQDAFFLFSKDEREFILTGTTPQEWNIMFPEMDE